MSCICDKCMNFPCGEETNMIIVCCDFEEKPKVLTNADRIRAMTDEELAHLLHSAEEHLFTGNLWNYEQWRDWLKAPVEEVDNG